jgi:predicted CopG family antitoxin
MVKTITIADDVYEELVKMKGSKSFSEVIRELLKKRKGNSDILIKMLGVLSEDEYKEAERRIKDIEGEFEKWQFSIQT